MGPQPVVALYVTGHGFGHAVRCAEVARALLDRGARVLVRTDAPAWLFPGQVEPLPSPGWPVDVGVAQRDGLDMDIPMTRTRWEAFGRCLDERAAVEADLLRRHAVQIVLADVPPLAFAAAARAGLPSAGMTNFTWDWIYDGWEGFAPIVNRVRAAYRHADLLLRLPFHPIEPSAFAAFNRVEDVPLVARRASRSREDLRRELSIPLDARAVLLSFGGFDAASLDLQALGAWSNYLFLWTPSDAARVGKAPANVRCLPRRQLDYPSLVAACDAVVTKPGYGIVADILANRVPALYTDRGPFREYPVLAQALEQHGRARYVPQAEVRAGRLGPHLDALLADTRPWTDLRLDGATVVAEQICQLADTRGRAAVPSGA